MPRVQHQQVRQVSEAELAIDAVIWRLAPFADRHPLAVRANCGGLARRPFSFAQLGIVIVRAVLPGVVRDLVVVPDADEGMLAMRGLQIRIALVLLVALPIVDQRHDLLVRHRHAAEPGAVTVGSIGVFIQVVTQVQHGIEIRAACDQRVDIEQAHGQVRAGRDGDARRLRVRAWQRARAADHRRRARRAELVVVGLRRIEAVDVHLDGEVPQDIGLHAARRDHPPHLHVARQFAIAPRRHRSRFDGVTRVQRMTRSCSGSPLATPCSNENWLPADRGARARTRGERHARGEEYAAVDLATHGVSMSAAGMTAPLHSHENFRYPQSRNRNITRDTHWAPGYLTTTQGAIQ